MSNTTVNIYLNFDGNCKAAFDFYKSVFGNEFSHISTFGEMPPQADMPIDEDMKNRIMHVALPISAETQLMGSDTGGEWSKHYKQGNNFSISVNNSNVEEAKQIFEKLSQNGQITMPMEKTFWGAYFGMLIDQFGINWQVNCELAEHQEFEKNNQ